MGYVRIMKKTIKTKIGNAYIYYYWLNNEKKYFSDFDTIQRTAIAKARKVMEKYNLEISTIKIQC